MPLLGALIQALVGRTLAFFSGIFGAALGLKLTAAVALAAGYVAAVVAFSAFVGPLFGAVFNTQFGYVLGLLFPPVSGTVLAGLVTYWGAVIVFQYSKSIWRAAAG